MLKVYGSMLCKDCVACREAYDRAGIDYTYLDFADDLVNLKEFLAIREGNHLFDEIRAAGGIGIPCVLREDGTVTLDWESCM